MVVKWHMATHLINYQNLLTRLTLIQENDTESHSSEVNKLERSQTTTLTMSSLLEKCIGLIIFALFLSKISKYVFTLIVST